jgi:hypothetical protein
MYNWSIDLDKFKKHSRQYQIWKLEQMINFGLNTKKISTKLLKKYFFKLRIDPDKKAYLKFLLSQ